MEFGGIMGASDTRPSLHSATHCYTDVGPSYDGGDQSQGDGGVRCTNLAMDQIM